MVLRSVACALVAATVAGNVGDRRRCSASHGQCTLQETWGKSSRADVNTTDLLRIAQRIMASAQFAVMTTNAMVQPGAPPDLSSRVVSPKPVPNISGADGLDAVFIDTNIKSRKYAELKAAISAYGVARTNLLYWDSDEVSYVALRGNATLLSAEDSKKEWWDGWGPFFPDGANTSFYTVVRLEPDGLELVAVGGGENVQSGRADWLPVTLRRPPAGAWVITVPPEPAPAPSPPAPPAPASGWKCSLCGYKYDAAKDGGGKPFEELPDAWKCPICGASKSAFIPQTSADGTGEVEWVHAHTGPEGVLHV